MGARDLRLSLAVALVAITGACSALRIFNTVMPKDAGSARIADGLRYGADDRQKLDLYAPRGPHAPLPVIVFFYGGSWSSGTRAGYGFVGRALAARGFLVVIPDYRLVPKVHYPAFVEDGAAAVRWTLAHAGQWGGDPARLVLAGHSAGAYNTAMLALDPRWLGADRARVRGWIGLAGPYDFLPFSDAGAVVERAFAGAADPPQTQPICHVARGDPPALLANGDKDTVVEPRNSDALADALDAAGTKVMRRRYPKVGHIGLITAVAQPLRGHAPVLDDMARFAAAVTAGEPIPAGDPLIPARMKSLC